MKSLLLILILVGDHRAEQLANRVAGELQRDGHEQVQVLVAAEAVGALERRHVQAEDIVADPQAARKLTAADADLAIVDLRYGEGTARDAVDSRISIAGADSHHIVVAANGGDPLAATVATLESACASRVDAFAAKRPPLDDATLAAWVERGEWPQIVARLHDLPKPTVRQSYDLVLAYARLGRAAQARSAFAAMKDAYPEEALVAQAEQVLPTEEKDAGPAPDAPHKQFVTTTILQPGAQKPAP